MFGGEVAGFPWVLGEIIERPFPSWCGRWIDFHGGRGLPRLLQAHEFPIPFTEGEDPVVVALLEQVVAAPGALFPEEGGKHVEAVEAGVVRDRLTC